MKKILISFFIILVFFVLYTCFLVVRPTSKQTELKFSSWGSQSEVLIIKKLIHQFEVQNPDIKVTFMHIPQNYFQKLHLLFASNQEPDVIFVNNHYLQMYIHAGLLEDLTPYFSSAESAFFSQALDCFKSENKLYAIPRDISNLVIFYNKDIFKQKNVQMPYKLENLSELKEIAIKVNDSNHFAINTEEIPLYLLLFLASNGGGVIDDDKKNIIIDSHNSVNAINLYRDFSQKYHISPTKSEIGSMTTAQMFVNKKLAMYISGRWMVPKFRETIEFNWDIIPFPHSKNKLYIDSSGWAISKKSKNKEAAIKLVDFLASKQSSEYFCKSGLIIPARKEVAYSNLFLDPNLKPNNSVAFLDTIIFSKPTPTNENYNKINDIIAEKLQIFINGNYNFDEIFDNKTIKKLELELK